MRSNSFLTCLAKSKINDQYSAHKTASFNCWQQLEGFKSQSTHNYTHHYPSGTAMITVFKHNYGVSKDVELLRLKVS